MTLSTLAVAFICLADPGRSLEFPSSAPTEWVERGREWGESPSAGWRCAAPFQVQIGWRHAGPVRQPMEFAWRFAPGFVASRLGFLQRRDHFDDQELVRRWASVRGEVDGRLVFLVQLAASPQNDVINAQQSGSARLDELDQVRFVLISGKTVVQPTRLQLAYKQRSNEFSLLVGFPWHQFAPGAPWLVGEFESIVAPDPYTLGIHHLRLYRIEFRLEDLPSDADQLSLRVLSKNKERVANFAP